MKGLGGGAGRLIERWVAFSIRRTWWVIGIGTVAFWVSAYFASRLDLRSDFIELLPTDSPSVKSLDHLKERVASYATLTVAIESPDLGASQRFADDLVERLRTFPYDRIRFIDYNLNELTDFYKRNKWLYADLADLVDFRDRLRKRIEEETRASVVEWLDDEPAPKTDLRIDELKAKYEKKVEEQERYPDGYYVTPDRSLLAVFVRPPSTMNSHEEAVALVRDVRAEVEALGPSRYHPAMKVGFTGEVMTGIEEREALASDARFISTVALLLVLGSIVVYFRSLRSVMLIGMPMLLGLVVAFAVGYFAVGYLNTATAFLGAIIAGNGINTMIMVGARFYEEIRRLGPGGLEEALRIAYRATARGTLVADVTSAIAYGSLVAAGFRGFRQFGVIGGVGMVACWLASYAFGPALIAALHRFRPLGARQVSGRHPVSRAVARLVLGHPRTILATATALSVASVLFLIPFAQDPFEYDFHNLRNRESVKRGSAKLSNRVDKIFDLPRSPTPILAEDLASVPLIQRAILDDPAARGVIQDVQTLLDYLPTQQEEKLAVLADIRALIDRKIDFLDEKEQADVLEYRPPESLRVLTVADIPDLIARPFTEVDGTRGRILYAYHPKSESLLDGRFLLRYAHVLRSVRSDGEGLVAVGQAMVFADMIRAIEYDGVLVTVLSVAGVLLFLAVSFRSPRALALVMTPLLCGLLWMLGSAAIFDLKINFLNFVVIPITIGIGVAYAAYLYARIRQEGPERIPQVIESTGGAVFLTALTTIIGYATLITSTNMALQSFGILADIGEVVCLGASEIVLTALVVTLARRSRSRT